MKKNKLKKVRILELVAILLILLTSVPVFVLTWIFSSHLLYANYIVILVYVTMVMPIIIYLLEFIVEIKVDGYKEYQYLSFWAILVEILGVGTYLVLVNLITPVHFGTWKYLLFCLIPLSVIVPAVITYIYGRKKGKSDKPKIVRR